MVSSDLIGAVPVVGVEERDTHDTDNGPGNTIDGKPGTRWSAEGDGEWIQWDLGSVHELSRVRLAFFQGDTRRAAFDLEVSADGRAFTSAVQGRRSSGTTTGLEDVDFSPVSGRFVRYVGHGNTQNDWNSLTEVEIDGSAVDAPPVVDHPGGGPRQVDPGSAQVTPYPRVDSLKTSQVFHVVAGEKEIWTEDFTRNRPAHIAAFSATGTVSVRITNTQSLRLDRISPQSRHIEHEVHGDTVSFSFTAPDKLIVFFENSHGDPVPLYLLADPPETQAPPNAGDHGVHFFGPGTTELKDSHGNPVDLKLSSNETVYLAAGARLVSRIHAENAQNVTIRGRGILWERENAPGDSTTIRLQDCRHVTVEGITIRDVKKGWSTRYDRCDDVKIEDVKLFSCGINEDGIDPCGCTNFTVNRCLISTGDDCIAIKSFSPDDNVSVVNVFDTTLDSYPHGGGGDGIKIGTETRCHSISGVTVRGCDVVRAYGANSDGGHSAFSIVVHSGNPTISGITYDDVRVEDVEHKNFEIRHQGSGKVTNVTLTNIAWAEAGKAINLIGSGVGGVRFEHCTVADKALRPDQVNHDGAAAPVIDP